jgi:hypothetical protein
MTNQLQRAVLRTLARGHARSMIGTAEQLSLPTISRPAGEGRPASGRESCLELISIDAVGQQRLRDGHRRQTVAIGMKVHDDPRAALDAAGGIGHHRVDTAGILYQPPQSLG